MYSISFAGAGNVASSLCLAFFAAGHRIVQVTSRGKTGGSSLAQKVNAVWTDSLRFDRETDFIIVSVPDNALADVLGRIECSKRTIILHTAGSYGLEVFPPRAGKKGVLYPLQTFSKGRKIDFGDVPFLIEASDSGVRKEVTRLAGILSGRVVNSDTEQRKMIHLAAVFACNFVNHLLALSEDIASRGSFNFDILHPLIRETVSKALESGPSGSQTGPAVRNDINTVRKHLELLSFSPGMRNLYKELTDSIIDFYKK
ncbi:MAG TPA: DUF2520 domain-containing protein [Bacteroidales bacterium]|nr:DUF2520 domain-containing protein [Bacteroidales bacterium]